MGAACVRDNEMIIEGLKQGAAQAVAAQQAQTEAERAAQDPAIRRGTPATAVAQGLLERETRGLEVDRQAALIDRLRDELDARGRSRLLIDKDEDAGRFVYRMLDPETGETMRQWPPENYLDLISYLREEQGGLIDKRV